MAEAVTMPEMLFYQLGPQPHDQALTALLQKTLERGLRAVVRLDTPERLAALDNYLWTFDDASFLPHSPASDEQVAHQPIVLTTGRDNPGQAQICFLVHGSQPVECDDYQRVVYIFSGADDAEKAAAREHWRNATKTFDAVTFWKQNQHGSWEKQG